MCENRLHIYHIVIREGKKYAKYKNRNNIEKETNA